MTVRSQPIKQSNGPIALRIREVNYRGSGLTVSFSDDTVLEGIYNAKTGGLDIPGITAEQKALLDEYNGRAKQSIYVDKRFNVGGGTRLLVQSIEDNFFRFLPYNGVLELWKYTRKKSGPHVKKFAPFTVYPDRLGKRYRRYRILGRNVTEFDATETYTVTNSRRSHWYRFVVRLTDTDVAYDPHYYKVSWNPTILAVTINYGGQFKKG